MEAKSAPIITLVASDGMEVSGPSRTGVQAAMGRYLATHPDVKIAKDTTA